MKAITPEGLNKLQDIANRFNLNNDTVLNMLQAVVNGRGTMAQFNIPELGGGGQWMQGGMTMVGDMFNYSLKNTVNALCAELANLMYSENIFIEPAYQPGSLQSSGNWWPAAFGSPSSSGAQNNFKYAYFPYPVCRLAIDNAGQILIYNTLNHQISGVSQQQGSSSSFSFSSQFGFVDTLTLPLISDSYKADAHLAPIAPVAPITSNVYHPDTQAQAIQTETSVGEPSNANISPSTYEQAAPKQSESKDIFGAIENLAGLLQKGYITDAEFQAKKLDLLSRL